MKKFLVVLLAFAVAGAVFAQDLVLKGGVRTGIIAGISDQKGDDKLMIMTHSLDGYAWRLEMKGEYTNAAGNAGFKFNVVSKATEDSSGKYNAEMNTTDVSTYADNARLWIKGFDNKATFFGGKVDDGGPLGVNGTGAIDTTLGVAGGRGIHIRIEPIDGLALGVGIFPDVNKFFRQEFKYADYRFGVAYTLPDTVQIVAIGAYDTAGYDYGAAVPSLQPGAYKKLTAYAAASILALKPMGLNNLIFDARFEDLTSERKAEGMEITIGEKVVFVQNDLEVGAKAKQKLRTGTDADKAAYAPDLYFEAWGNYKLNEGKIVPQLSVRYDMGTPLDDNNYGDGVNDGGFTKDKSNLAVSPSVNFKFTSPGNIKAGYTLHYDLSKNALYSMRNVFYLDYEVSF